MRVLVFIDYYLPGYRAGGPLRTMENIVATIGHEHDFLIITRDHDLGSKFKHDQIQFNSWNQIGLASVFYVNDGILSFYKIWRLILNTPHDVFYMNSYLSLKMTFFPLLLRWLKLVNSASVVLAPRGEFASGALKLKRIRKLIYINSANILRIYQNILWQASSQREAEDIHHALKIPLENIFIIPDIVTDLRHQNQPKKLSLHSPESNVFRLIFLSRISPMKNLDYVIRTLNSVHSNIEFSIYGPIEDEDYWEHCKDLINLLPKNILVNVNGPIRPEKISDIFSQYNLMILPSHGENFGHVIFESLLAGTPVLISDNTPWVDAEGGAIKTLPLSNIEAWSQEIMLRTSLSLHQRAQQRISSFNYAQNFLHNNPSVDKMRTLFNLVLEENAL